MTHYYMPCMQTQNHTCLQDVLDEIFYTDCMGGAGWEEECTAALLKFGTKETLVDALDRYFLLWDAGARNFLDEYEEIDGVERYERASWCFYHIYNTLPWLKDTSVIPDMLQYLPFSPDRDYMFDMFSESMFLDVTNYEAWGLSYILWVMESLHRIPHSFYDNEFVIRLLDRAVGDTFRNIQPDQFPECLPALDALPSCNKPFVLRMLDISIQECKESIEDDLQKGKDVSSYKEGLARREYVRGQLLLMMDQKA